MHISNEFAVGHPHWDDGDSSHKRCDGIFDDTFYNGFISRRNASNPLVDE